MSCRLDTIHSYEAPQNTKGLTQGESFEEEKLLDSLEEHYILKGAREISDFLKENENLVKLLDQAPAHIAQHFGKDELLLKISYDPEEETKRLMIYIRTSSLPAEADERLSALDDGWWLDASNAIDPEGRLGINIEFK